MCAIIRIRKYFQRWGREKLSAQIAPPPMADNSLVTNTILNSIILVHTQWLVGLFGNTL